MNKTPLMLKITLPLLFIVFVLSGCSTQFGRYQQANDSHPARLPTSAELRDATPRIEAKSRGGNKNYTVRGKHYQVLPNAEGFTQSGIASWYGKKFHGHLTSNGEIYDMYAMSAAHKNLPLPTYLKVTNTANNKSVVVRVNDRGPFHHNRIIDLSYSAAYKLDMLKTGTANVHISAITDPHAIRKDRLSAHNAQQIVPPIEPLQALTAQETPEMPKVATSDNIYIQVFATKSKKVALDTAQQLSKKFTHQVLTPHHQGIYRIQLGPFDEHQNIEPIITTLKQSGYPNAYRRKILQ